jgi:hypothetical protein
MCPNFTSISTQKPLLKQSSCPDFLFPRNGTFFIDNLPWKLSLHFHTPVTSLLEWSSVYPRNAMNVWGVNECPTACLGSSVKPTSQFRLWMAVINIIWNQSHENLWQWKHMFSMCGHFKNFIDSKTNCFHILQSLKVRSIYWWLDDTWQW